METRIISIIHATRRQKESFEATNHWLSNAYHKSNIEYILSVDNSDPQIYEDGAIKIIRNDNRSAIDAFNRGAEIATGDLFVCISDDMKCPPIWDVALLKVTNKLNDFYLKVRDGLQPTLVTLPIFDRTYYERLGYVWNPGFRHMFCDQEATAVAIMLGRYVKSDLLFPHAHYTIHPSKYDDVNVKNDSTWAQGEALFNERLKSNFGLKESEIVKPYSSIVWH